VRQDRFAEAELMVAEGLLLLGFGPVLASRFAELAAQRQDLKTAAQRWALAVRHLPDHEPLHHALAQALRQLDGEAAHRGLALDLRQRGHLAELETVLDVAVKRFPDSLALAVEHAWAATARGDLPTAVARWQALLARDPKNMQIRQGLETALLQSGLPPPMVGHAPALPGEPGGAETTPDAGKLMLCFEALGVNCELGLAQRRAGVEPLGLLRFAGITVERLITALDTDFAGVGEPEFTHVYLRDGVEYMISDTRYGLHMHSFTGPGEVSLEQFARGTHTRLRFLARKLREDLRDANKICARRVDKDPESQESHMRLLGALRRHGDNTLLLVASSDDPHRLGRAEWLAPGLMQGWIADSAPSRINYEAWLAVCRSAHALWTAARSQTTIPPYLTAG
jgi:tetratricopeptide (TPR) repeat protein